MSSQAMRLVQRRGHAAHIGMLDPQQVVGEVRNVVAALVVAVKVCKSRGKKHLGSLRRALIRAGAM